MDVDAARFALAAAAVLIDAAKIEQLELQTVVAPRTLITTGLEDLGPARFAFVRLPADRFAVSADLHGRRTPETPGTSP